MPLVTLKCKKCDKEFEYLTQYEELVCKECGNKRLSRVLGRASRIEIKDSMFSTPVDIDSKKDGSLIRFPEYTDRNSGQKWVGNPEIIG